MKKIYTVLVSLLLILSVKAQIIVLQPDAAGGIDTYVSCINDSTNYGNDPYLYFGGAAWQSDTFNLYLKFDLTSIAPGTTINTARIDVYVKGQNGYMSGHQYGVYKVTQPWGEDTLYWYNQPSHDTAMIYTFDGELFQMAYMQGWRTIFLPDTLVQKWVDDPLSNNGIMIKSLNDFYGYPYIASSDGTDAECHPRIILNSNGSKIYGIVTDSITHDPLQGVPVSAYDISGTVLFESDTSDASGNYTLNVMYPDTYKIFVEGISGYMPAAFDSIILVEGFDSILNIPLSPNAHAIAGIQTGTWNAANSPFIVTGNVIVPDSTLLSIEPGVIVQYAGPYMICVFGSLKAIGTPVDTIVFTSYDTITEHRGHGIRFYQADTSVIEYCLVENMYNFDHIPGSGASMGGGIYSDRTYLTISHNTIRRNFATSGGGMFIASYFASTPCFISQNLIEDNTGIYNSSSYEGGAGVFIYSNDAEESVFFHENIIANNEFIDNTCGNFEGGGGMKVVNGKFKIINNTFINNKSKRGSAVYAPMFNGKILNNVFWFNSGSFNNEQVALDSSHVGADFEASYNCIQDSGIIIQKNNILSLDTVPGVGNIYVYPEFADTVAGHYWLGSNSPCIDSASNNMLFTQYDFIDRCRVFDGDADGTGIVDMGAYEYNAHDMLFVDLGDGFSVCSETPVQLGVQNFWESYSWSTGDSTNMIDLMGISDTFYLTVSQTGCYAFDSVAATVYQTPVIHLHPDTAFCGYYFDIDAGSGLTSYLWNDTITGTDILHATGSGEYWVYVTTEHNCSAYSDTMNLDLYLVPDVNLSDTAIPLSSGSVMLNAGMGYEHYHWSNGATTHLIVIFANSLGIGTHHFYVTVTSDHGCVDTAGATVVVYNDAGLDEYGDMNISIFPNPAGSQVSITGVPLEENIGVIISDELGRVVVSRNILKPEEVNIVDVSQLSQGMYNIRITGNKSTKVMKFIKQ